jgi:hypothetical protein
MGLTRVILSRELSLDEIEEIRQECPDMELEVFVHGALCIAYSGRCLLSVTSITAIRIRVPAPIPAAGITRFECIRKRNRRSGEYSGRNHQVRFQ